MLIIRCARCRCRIFKYEKIGKGRVLRCYKVKIKEDYTVIIEGLLAKNQNK